MAGLSVGKLVAVAGYDQDSGGSAQSRRAVQSESEASVASSSAVDGWLGIALVVTMTVGSSWSGTAGPAVDLMRFSSADMNNLKGSVFKRNLSHFGRMVALAKGTFYWELRR